MTRKFLSTWYVLLLTTAASGQQAATKKNPLESEAAQRGRKQFAQSCAFCHGANATGGAEGPNLVRSSVVRHDESGSEIGNVIRQGRPNGGMPAIPLNEKQIADVVAYLHALVEVSDRTSAGRPARDYSLKRLLTGNAEAGRAYFNGVGNCASCHSVTGDLAGIARRYAPVELQARFLYPAAKTTNAKVTLHSGEVVSGTLIHQDDFYVAVEDKSGWYHSWPARDVKVDLEDPLKAHKELLSRYSQADMHNVFAYLETLQ